MTSRRGLRILSAADLTGLMSLDEAIDSQKAAFIALATGDGYLAPRLLVPGPSGDTTFVYAARTSRTAGVVAKVGSVVASNQQLGLPSVSATVLALDPITGRPRALLDGEPITTLRTVAASMLAAQNLCPLPGRVAVIGYGAQGRAHASAAAEVLDCDEVVVWAPELPARLKGSARRAHSAAEAVSGADLIFTCTTSRTPVISPDWLLDNTVIISVGSFAPDRCEVGPEVLRQATVIVDDVATARAQAGPVRQAIADGNLRPSDLRALGEVLLIGVERTERTRWTYYNSVGLGIQDSAIAEMLVSRAEAAGLGTVLPW